LPTDALLDACLVAESTVAGRHLDNLAPSLLGGICLVRSMDPIDVVRLSVPEGLYIVLAYPAQRLRTAEARAVLPGMIDRATALHQAAQVGAIVAALASGDLALLGRAIDDRIAEPARAPLIPGFREVKAAALTAGALGASIYGLSTQTTEYQREMATRLQLPYPVLSDADLQLTYVLRLPTFQYDGSTLLRRFCLIVRGSRIAHVIYPVFPSNADAPAALQWLEAQAGT